jgi:hypothetical protein
MRRIGLTAVCLQLCAALAGAQPAAVQTGVPRVVRFDGVVPATSGLAPALAETVTLAIYATDLGGAPIWEEVQELPVDASGRYSVLVGATRLDGLPPEVLAGDEPRWLEVRFARSTAIPPRVRLTSVPYALRAGDADTVGGLPASAFLRAPEHGAASGEAAGDSAAPTRETAPRVNTGTANYLGKFTNTQDLTSSIVYETAGRIGVGVTTPLDIVHTRFTDATGGLTGLAVQNLGSSAASYSGMLFYDQNGALGQFQGFNNSTHEYRINNIASGGSINFMLGSTSRFRVRPDGDIDISGSLRRNGTLWTHELGAGQNVALGREALVAVTTGATNTAVGYQALMSAQGAGGNTAVGKGTLRLNVAGQQNVALGYDALRAFTGSYGIAIGAFAGADKVTGDRNIYIGQGVGSFVANTESDTIRIGDFGGNYTRFFAGGVRGVTTGQSNAVAVMIDGNGQLGTVNSSRRYKSDIQDMGDASSGLMRLRPVTYRYAAPYADGSQPLDYGLIAEEVEQVYPDLVAHLAGGEVETVQYHKINAMLLNEVQKQHRLLGEQASRIDAQRQELEALKARLAALEARRDPPR